MSHYLTFRYIKDETIHFYENLQHSLYKARPQDEEGKQA